MFSTSGAVFQDTNELADYWPHFANSRLCDIPPPISSPTALPCHHADSIMRGVHNVRCFYYL